MHSHEWLLLLQAYFCFVVVVRSSAADPNNNEKTLTKWLARCKSCQCKKESQGISQLVLKGCREKAFIIDRRGKLTEYTASFSWFNKTPSAGQFSCDENVHKNSLNPILLSFVCKTKRYYVIYKRSQRRLNLTPGSNSTPTLSSTSSSASLTLTTLSPSQRITDSHSTIPPSKQKEKHQDNRQKSPNRLVLGLSIALGIMVFAVALCGWIRCRRRKSKKKSDEAEQSPEFGYIDEEEDSVPYRIVDLSTNVSCDASGYTFLAARNPDEDPYMKLQPRCKRTHKERTEDLNHSFEEAVNEDEDRPYETLRPTESDNNMDCTKNHDFEEIADEPVYFMLETKENPKNKQQLEEQT